MFFVSRNKLVVIDWKTSEKMKTSVSMTYDAPLQIAAYIGALNFDPSYPFKVSWNEFFQYCSSVIVFFFF
jgi:hypothetical protein